MGIGAVEHRYVIYAGLSRRGRSEIRDSDARGKAPVHQLSDLLSDDAPANTHLLRDWNAPGHTISFGASQSPFGDALFTAEFNWAALRIRTIDANEGYMPSDWEYIAAVYGVHLRPGL